MSRLLLACFVFVIAAAHHAEACIWSYGTDLRGKKVEVEGLEGVDLEVDMLDHDSSINWKAEAFRYKSRAAQTTDPKIKNDYAVTLLHIGETAEAIRILRALEKAKPGNYVTAANLGTALELAGQNAEALQWIREGIRRNKNAHEGTEWLHVRILEAKLALQREPQWLATHSVLGMDFGAADAPQPSRLWPADNTGRRTDMKSVGTALYYQLHERVQFVAPPDPVVASLLFDWANLAALTSTLETADALYQRALAYGPQNAPLVRKRQAYVRALLKKYK